MNSNLSPIEDGGSLSQSLSPIADGAARQRYETPQLISHGRLRHLTQTGVSGSVADDGDTETVTGTGP